MSMLCANVEYCFLFLVLISTISLGIALETVTPPLLSGAARQWYYVIQLVGSGIA